MCYILGVVHGPPNASAELLINRKEYLLCHARLNGRLILTGDFNLPSIDWTTMYSNVIEQSALDLSVAFDLL